MSDRKHVLIVEDNLVNRAILRRLLTRDYELSEAENGQVALEMLKDSPDRINAVLLDLVMPVMDGFEFLSRIRQNADLQALPVLVMTQQDAQETEIRALSLGASDFIAKPYEPTILKQRLSNLLLLSEAAALRNTNERDTLTGLYNRDTFFRKAGEMLQSSSGLAYDIITCDVQRFKIINDLFGMEEGNRLLQAIAGQIRARVRPGESIACRLVGDCFALCQERVPGAGEELAESLNRFLSVYPLDFGVHMVVGVYGVENPTLNVGVMCDRANMAVETIKGVSQTDCAHYNDTHRRRLLEEQAIVGEMAAAMRERQFEVFIQPKFDLATLQMTGGEALVRWRHPVKGLISPGVFIPVFERNGFITTLDNFIWEEVCRLQRGWLDRGLKPLPISANVSRVDIYNPATPDFLEGLIRKYDLPHELLELEITETAYTESPEQLIRVSKTLGEMGFTIEMDDFGSGYSSLNMLNEVPVDVVKLDMSFLRASANGGRSGNILNFILNLARWLDLKVVAEGVETPEQVAFLRSMGYGFGQGYYFAKPLPVSEFERRWLSGALPAATQTQERHALSQSDLDELWQPASRFNLLFNDFVGALVVFERKQEELSLLRANDRCFESLPIDRALLDHHASDLLSLVLAEDRGKLLAMLDASEKHGEPQAGDIRFRLGADRELLCLHIGLRAMLVSGGHAIFFCSVEDVTTSRILAAQTREQLEWYRRLLNALPAGRVRMEMRDGALLVTDLSPEAAALVQTDDGSEAMQRFGGEEPAQALSALKAGELATRSIRVQPEHTIQAAFFREGESVSGILADMGSLMDPGQTFPCAALITDDVGTFHVQACNAPAEGLLHRAHGMPGEGTEGVCAEDLQDLRQQLALADKTGRGLVQLLRADWNGTKRVLLLHGPSRPAGCKGRYLMTDLTDRLGQ